MIRMSAVWDRTVEVLSGRAGILAVIALLTVALPSIVQGLVAAGTTGSTNLIGSVIAFLLTTWGSLAITAVGSDPAVSRSAGLRIGARAMPRTIVTLLILLLGATVLCLPGALLLMRSGYDLAAAGRGDAAAAMANAQLGPFMIYAVVVGLLLLWLCARLSLLFPVLVNEPVSIGAYRRSFALTRGLALRIIGVLLLFLIVASVIGIAVQTVFGTVFRLLLGAEQAQLATGLTAAVMSLVVTGLTVVQTVFVAQLYRATRGEPEQQAAPEAALTQTGPWG